MISQTPSSYAQDVVALTQRLVQVDSGPTNLVAGENATCDIMQKYAKDAGLQVDRFETVHGKPALIVTLPGKNPHAPAVGFVHHSDVVGLMGTWKTGPPFGGNIITDDHGRQVLEGRGSIDTKGPAAQILVAMKELKDKGEVLDRPMKLFVFPDEETGGVDGAYYLSRTHPEKMKDVSQWVVEASGIMSPELLAGTGVNQNVPYLAVASKYCLPVQLQLKTAQAPDAAIHTTMDALDRLDGWVNKRTWTQLGSKAESQEMYNRLGNLVGGIKGWAIRHFWWTSVVEKQLGPTLAAANRTDFTKTDFYLSSNAQGSSTQDINVKPSSASAVLAIQNLDDATIAKVQKAAGSNFTVTKLQDGSLQVTMPQDKYQSDNHGSTPDRVHDAVDMTEQAIKRIQKALRNRVQVTDFFTDKSVHTPSSANAPVTANVTLDLRIAVDDDRQAILDQLAKVAGPDFTVKPLFGKEEMDAHIRRLSSQSPLFKAAVAASQDTYGPNSPLLFGNTTASNDCRYLQDINPQSETLTFVPDLYTNHGAHSPDECAPVEQLQSGVQWFDGLMEKLGRA